MVEVDRDRCDPRPLANRSVRQRSVRRHCAGMPLRQAVRSAVRAYFHFTHRATRSKALWCETERVWLGSQTFLHWALCDADIDVPWSVAAACDAPEESDQLRAAVRDELAAYWTSQAARLPRMEQPGWLPLP